MATPADVDLDALWTDFHDAVNMTSRELREWLHTEAATEESDELPDQADPELGDRVVDVLSKRRTDLTSDDVAVMQEVVERIDALRGDIEEPAAGDAGWRRRLMNLGHDPLKPPR